MKKRPGENGQFHGKLKMKEEESTSKKNVAATP